MKCAVISGGGNRGGYMAGLLQQKRPEYQTVYGNSTGANMAIHTALGLYDDLALSYANLTNNIYKRNPLNCRGKVSWVKAAFGLIAYNGFGDLSGLRELLEKNITDEVWGMLQDSGKNVVVAVTEMGYDPMKLTSVDSRNVSRSDMLDAIYASSCFWPMVSPHKGRYIDGGHMETILIDWAVDGGHKPEDIDVYVCREPFSRSKAEKPKNFIQTAESVIKGFRYVSEYEDLFRALDRGQIKWENIYWMQRGFDSNPMDFSRDVMQEIVKAGKNHKF